MIKLWIQNDKCTGCGACENICPKDAIHLKPDKYGFIHPQISDTCIDCGTCKKVCEARFTRKSDNAIEPITFAAWSKDSKTRFTSTSGGVFSELAKFILASNGVIVGAQYTSNNYVEHTIIENENNLERIRQSKYIQSNIGIVFRNIKSHLKKGRLVGFCGAPCQVAGLYAYLGKDYENLFTFDFICRGMNSPKALQAWLTEIENKEGVNVSKVWFKYKIDGWKKSPRCTRIDFTDGTNIVKKQEDNLFMLGYLNANLYIRPCCGDCDFKNVPRVADITLADFWGLSFLIDDDMGTSMVLVNNEKGYSLFKNISNNIIMHERKFEEIFKENECFNSSVWINPKSKEFLLALDNMPFSEAFVKYTRPTLKKKVKRKIKRILGLV